MYLAIDTSTNLASIAVVQDGQMVGEYTWHCGQNHTTELLPTLTNTLNQFKLSMPSIKGIIVAIGPGSFNGLRVGVSTAKGLAFSLGIPIVGISTLSAAAYPYAETGLPICPIHNAGRGEIATAIYRKKRQKWCQVMAENITTVDALCPTITTKTIFCGELTPDTAYQFKQQLGRKAVTISSPAARLRRAGYLAELGLKRLEAGDFDNPATLQPLYLRRPHITKPKRR